MKEDKEIKKRGWKSWPAWVKGGVIGVVLDVLLILFVIFSSSPAEADLLALYIFQIPFSYLIIPFGYNLPLVLIVGLFGWFLSGAIIGLIVGKIKSSRGKK